MKVVLLAPASSIHTQRWADGLADRGLEVVVATQHPTPSWPAKGGPRVLELPFRGQVGYFCNGPVLRRHLKVEKPDILNAHYASGYGTTAALTRFSPSLLSVWGSDVFDFPRASKIKERLLRSNLASATRRASTSEVMARHTQGLAPRLPAPFVTPFGVDTATFVPRQGDGTSDGVTVGIVKALYPKYGVDVLLRAVAGVVERGSIGGQIRLRIVGDGPERSNLEALATRLGIADIVDFAGAVPHAEVPDILRGLDVFVAPSRLDSESFGVAVVEASACGLPVVVSDVAGLSEVVRNGLTGYVVPRDDTRALSQALASLVGDPQLRRSLGQAGRALVEARYDWEHCLDTMIEAYRATIAAERGPRPTSSGER